MDIPEQSVKPELLWSFKETYATKMASDIKRKLWTVGHKSIHQT